MRRLAGWAEQGGVPAFAGGAPVAPVPQASFPGATVTVYLQGTQTLATLFGDTLNTPKANPFVADATAYWFCYVAQGRYDVRFSGAGIATPFVLGDEALGNVLSSVLDWGADPTGVLDSSFAFQLAANAGGEQDVPPGNYLFTTTVVITNSVYFRGAGNGGYGATPGPGIPFVNLFPGGPNSATLDFFHVNAGGVTIEGIAFQGLGSRQGPNLGCCIVQGTDGSQSFGNVYRDLQASAHSIAIYIQNGTTWLIDHCYMSSYDCIRVENQGSPDSGDAFIRDCTLSATTIGGGPSGSCIKYLSGGGLKINQCKFLSCLIGLEVSWFAGSSTGPLLTNCSLEGYTQCGVSVLAGSIMASMLIHGNFFDTLVAGSKGAIFVQTGTLSLLSIVGNVIRVEAVPLAGSGSIDIDFANTTTIVGNTLSAVDAVSPIGIRIRSHCANGLLGVNQIQGYSSAWQVDGGATGFNTAFQP